MNTLERLFRESLSQPSDINEHVPALYRYGSGCRHITEFGTRTGTSTAAFLYCRPEALVTYDVHRHSQVEVLQQAAGEAGVQFQFHQEDVLQAPIAPTDLLFIDTLHTYEQMRAELARHGNKARKYLIFHDTETFREQGEPPGSRGIWPAIVEFIRANPCWSAVEHRPHNNGLTVLKRELGDGRAPPSRRWLERALAANAGRGSEQPDISAIVPVKGRVDLTEQSVTALRRCFECAEVGNEIIIVDSDEGSSRAWCEANGCQWVDYDTGGSFCYPRALNLGARAAEAPFLLFSNNDVVDISADFVARGLTRFARNPTLGLACVGYPAGTPYALGGNLWFTGCLYMVRRTAWETIGGACEELSGYGWDEADTSIRLGYAGYVVECLVGTSFVHHQGSTFGAYRGALQHAQCQIRAVARSVGVADAELDPDPQTACNRISALCRQRLNLRARIGAGDTETYGIEWVNGALPMVDDSAAFLEAPLNDLAQLAECARIVRPGGALRVRVSQRPRQIVEHLRSLRLQPLRLDFSDGFAAELRVSDGEAL